ncbi:MAG TPA: sugar ABC transporter permease [Candidatus Limnocylindrales bacterium]|nr:sugar ABC transporter permease [Candidatus Limnocylindrales bacterium]
MQIIDTPVVPTGSKKSVEAVAPQRGKFIWGGRGIRYLLVAPSVILILSFTIFPILYLFWISFLDWTFQRRERPFIGLGNYIQVLQDTRMWEALGHTLFIMVVAVSAELILGLLLAQVLVGKLPGKQILIPLLILPTIMCPVVVGYGWRMLWDTQYGPINEVLGWILGHPVNLVWLINPKTVYFSLIVAEVWQWTPFMFLALLAGLSAINPELYEAAALDGATAWQTFWHMTLPLIRPIMIIALIIRSLDVFKIFDLIFALTVGGPGTFTETITFYIYTLGFKNFRLGYTAAMAFIVLILVSTATTLFLRRFSEE